MNNEMWFLSLITDIDKLDDGWVQIDVCHDIPELQC